MTPAEVPAELVETACRARWDAEGSVFNGHNGDVAYTWDALVALFPTEADTHRRRERAVLAVVLPEVRARAFESGARSYAASDPCCGTYHLHEIENPHTGEAIPTREGEDDL